MITVSNLTFAYTKKKVLFKNLNLSLQGGHIYGLLGKNGAGKSTLLKSMAGLVFPQSGSCRVNGFLASKRLPEFLQDFFFIPEEIYVPQISVSRFLKSTSCFYPRFNERLFYEFLSVFDVPADSLLTRLSFGQQKKVMLAFGLATNTSLLLMDEPTNGLDIPSKVQFRKIISSVLTENRTIIISTHQARDLDNLIDTLLVLHDQEIILNKDLNEIAERIEFTVLASVDEKPVLYAEEGIQGWNAITANNSGNYSKVDMGLLFNALTGNNSKSVIETLK